MSSDCFHCGQPVPVGAHYAVKIDDQTREMCCTGCQAVAQAIVENNLTEEKLTSSFFYKLLHSDVITFFYCISQLKMEGVFIDFNIHLI